MKKSLLLTACASVLMTANAQTAWDQVPEFSTYTDANNPVQAGGNNLLQGATFTSLIMNDSWAPVATQAGYSGNSFTTGNITYTAPSDRGAAQWTGQMYFETQYAIEKGKKYDLTFHVKSTAANNFTVKVEDKNNNANSLCYYYVTLPANQEVLFVLKDASPETTLSKAKLVFDVGGAQVGSTIEISDIILQSADKLAATTPVTLTGAPEGYNMVWHDEFDDPANLTKNWNAMDWAAGNVNHELQTYKPGDRSYTDRDGVSRKTLEIKDGKLLINLFQGNDGKIYSGRIDSHDATADHSGYAAWRYGYMEARIKLPSGKGTWPAYWMMPEGVNWSDETWPTCGEIDIMEEVGNDPNNCVCSLHAIGHYHANNTQISASRHVDNMEGGWVTYALLWDNDNMAMYANGQRILTYANDHNGYVNWPYDRPYYITLNLAYGGDWGGAAGLQDQLQPCTMEVEYVRVYQKTPEALNTDGTGTAYIQGGWNAVAIDGIVPSSTFSSQTDNFIPMTNDNKLLSKTFTVGKNLHKDRVGFMIRPAANTDNVFRPNGGNYNVSMEENDLLTMNNEGWITLKPGASLADGDTFVLVLDCSAGTNNAVIRVVNEIVPVKKPQGVWIIGANNSVVPDMLTTDNIEWKPEKALQMQESEDVYTYSFDLGSTLSRTNVNFKFFCQAGWGDEFKSGGTGYRISSASEYLGIGTGTDGHDDGNVYKLKDFPEDARTMVITVNCKNGYRNAVLNSYFIYDGESPAKPEGIWIIGADQSVVPDLIDNGSWEWNESKAIKMDEENNIHFYTFELGKTLSRNTINFKFFPQNGFKNANGDDTAFLGTAATRAIDSFHISSASEYLGIGTGANNHDNGNVYKLKDFPARKYLELTVDCSNGYNNAIMRTNFTDSLPTEVENISGDAEGENVWYDLAGRRIATPDVPGFYIHGHKKVLVK